MFGLNLYQFADPGACSPQEPHHKIPEHVAVPFQATFQALIIPFGDNIIEERFLLMLYSGQLVRGKEGNAAAFTVFSRRILQRDYILVNAINPGIDRIRLIMLHQPYLIRLQVFHRHILVQGVVMAHRCQIGVNGIFRGTAFLEEITEIL